MILQALASYYERLLDDPKVDIPEPGFSKEKIHFEIILSPDGSLRAVGNIQEKPEKGKKLLPKFLAVPEKAKGRTSLAIVPNFLWDRVDYALGADMKGDAERSQKLFEAFKSKAHQVGNFISAEDSGMCAVLAFLDSWNPERIDEIPNWDEVLETTGPTVVFRLDGEIGYIHDSPAVKSAWLRYLGESESTEKAMCLVSGEYAPVTRLHHSLSGIRNANPTGAFLVAFNADAYFSYGKTYNQNAPVSERAAFAYATALNHMLSPGGEQKAKLADAAEGVRIATYGGKSPPPRRSIMVGDATTLFWTAEPTQAESDFFAFLDFKDESDPAHDKALLLRLRAVVDAVRKGDAPPVWDDKPKTPFYVLGLSPNAARLSVRFWLKSTVVEMLTRLGEHFADLSIESRFDKTNQYPSLWRMLLETAPARKNPDGKIVRKMEDVVPVLAGQIMSSIITGGEYPRSLVARIIGRIRAEQDVTYLRAALLKAYYARALRLGRVFKNVSASEVAVSLNPESKNPGYLLGRLFAILEKTQENALPGIKATIKDRFYGAASSTPKSVFPRLLSLFQHHLKKLSQDKKGLAITREKQLQDVIDGLDDIPAHLSLDDQAMFALGFYHQRVVFYPKKETPAESAE